MNLQYITMKMATQKLKDLTWMRDDVSSRSPGRRRRTVRAQPLVSGLRWKRTWSNRCRPGCLSLILARRRIDCCGLVRGEKARKALQGASSTYSSPNQMRRESGGGRQLGGGWRGIRERAGCELRCPRHVRNSNPWETGESILGIAPSNRGSIHARQAESIRVACPAKSMSVAQLNQSTRAHLNPSAQLKSPSWIHLRS
jgi:hypothetical protein